MTSHRLAATYKISSDEPLAFSELRTLVRACEERRVSYNARILVDTPEGGDWPVYAITVTDPPPGEATDGDA